MPALNWGTYFSPTSTCSPVRGFGAFAAGHGVADLVEDRIDDIFDVTLEEMRVLARKLFDQFRLDHLAPGRWCRDG